MSQVYGKVRSVFIWIFILEPVMVAFDMSCEITFVTSGCHNYLETKLRKVFFFVLATTVPQE